MSSIANISATSTPYSPNSDDDILLCVLQPTISPSSITPMVDLSALSPVKPMTAAVTQLTTDLSNANAAPQTTVERVSRIGFSSSSFRSDLGSILEGQWRWPTHCDAHKLSPSTLSLTPQKHNFYAIKNSNIAPFSIPPQKLTLSNGSLKPTEQ